MGIWPWRRHLLFFTSLFLSSHQGNVNGVGGQVHLVLQDWSRRSDEEQGQRGERGGHTAAAQEEASWNEPLPTPAPKYLIWLFHYGNGSKMPKFTTITFPRANTGCETWGIGCVGRKMRQSSGPITALIKSAVLSPLPRVPFHRILVPRNLQFPLQMPQCAI